MSILSNPAEGEELDLETLLQDVKAAETNQYISDEEKAIELIADLIRNDPASHTSALNGIKSNIDRLFALFEDIDAGNGLELYEQFLDLCARLSVQKKVKKLQDKVVISFGGAFSSGKSKFINSISGIEDILPVAQAPITSIPTYIISSATDALRANSIFGYDPKLTAEAMNALTHEFYDTYHIGFSAFVDSIIVESSRFSLPEGIALLDTPGYTKYDQKSNSKAVLSDRQQAFEQLRSTDYLMWLVDIENGGLTQEDISFIETLRIKTPILIVFTKADLKLESEVQSIISGAQKTIAKTAINCFGITAYSSNQRKEYGEGLIHRFIDFALNAPTRRNDLLGEFDRIEGKMRKEIQSSIDRSRNIARSHFSYITHSDEFLQVRSLITLWGMENQKGYQLANLLRQYENIATATRRKITEYIERG